MKVNRNTWHYKLWARTHRSCMDKDEELPAMTSVCAYVQWLLFVPLLLGLGYVLLRVVVLVVNAVAIPSGWGYTSFLNLNRLNRERLVEPFNWPLRLVIWAASAATIAWNSSYVQLWSQTRTGGLVIAFLIFVACIAAMIGVLILIAWGVITCVNSNTVQLAAAYLKAKKERVCPFVTFEG